MGIPHCFLHELKSHPECLVLQLDDGPIECLFVDSNSLVYDVVRDAPELVDYEAIVDQTCDRIDEIRRVVGPQCTYVAFDGVAPRGKLDHQQQRRWKSKHAQQGQVGFDTTQITPGTPFMELLSRKARQKWSALPDVIVSGSDEVGEGEHKMFAFLREHPSTTYRRVVVYGLDADLIMLSLLHTVPGETSLFLLRETQRFPAQYQRDASVPWQYISVDRLYASIGGVPEAVYTYVLAYFLLGNDFLPRQPSLHIQEGSVELIMQWCAARNGWLVDPHTRAIRWKQLRRLVAMLADQEESKLRRCFKRSPEEHHIQAGTPGWQRRYYECLFGMVDMDAERCRQICCNYVEGIQWVWEYYVQGCTDWQWRYQYFYPPLLRDLHTHLPYFTGSARRFAPRPPLSTSEVLAYVFPPETMPPHIPVLAAFHRQEYEHKWVLPPCFPPTA